MHRGRDWPRRWSGTFAHLAECTNRSAAPARPPSPTGSGSSAGWRHLRRRASASRDSSPRCCDIYERPSGLLESEFFAQPQRIELVLWPHGVLFHLIQFRCRDQTDRYAFVFDHFRREILIGVHLAQTSQEINAERFIRRTVHHGWVIAEQV